MKLGGEILSELFQSAQWRAYIGDDLMPWAAVEPLIGPNSIDVTLGDTFLVPKIGPGGVIHVDPRNDATLIWEKLVVSSCDALVLDPGMFVLGAVRERFVCEAAVEIKDCPGSQSHRKALFAPMYEGRSSCGRLGLSSNLSSGFGEYGFGGAFTICLVNHFPYSLILHPGMRIGQVTFEEVYRPKRYIGAYSDNNHNHGPVAPLLGPSRF